MRGNEGSVSRDLVSRNEAENDGSLPLSVGTKVREGVVAAPDDCEIRTFFLIRMMRIDLTSKIMIRGESGPVRR